jgi:hypothetical protein
VLERCSKTTFTYTGLRFILSRALNLTLERQCQGAAYLIKPSLKTYNMRQRSKAFEVFGWVNFPQSFSATRVEELKTKLQQAFALPDVSPLDVDQFGRNIAHICITVGSLLHGV